MGKEEFGILFSLVFVFNKNAVPDRLSMYILAQLNCLNGFFKRAHELGGNWYSYMGKNYIEESGV